MTSTKNPTTTGGMLVAEHYGIEERRIAATPECQAMFADLPNEMRAALAESDTPEFGFMRAAGFEYTRRTGDVGAHIGAVAGALRLIATGAA